MPPMTQVSDSRPKGGRVASADPQRAVRDRGREAAAYPVTRASGCIGGRAPRDPCGRRMPPREMRVMAPQEPE
jgi:hypothetical protein